MATSITNKSLISICTEIDAELCTKSSRDKAKVFVKYLHNWTWCTAPDLVPGYDDEIQSFWCCGVDVKWKFSNSCCRRSTDVMIYSTMREAIYHEWNARPPKQKMLASEENPCTMPKVLLILANSGFLLAASTFFDHPTSVPTPSSFSILCLCFIICIAEKSKSTKI